MAAEQVTESLSSACGLESVYIFEAKVVDEKEIIEFISKERPTWLPFIKENIFEIVNETFPGSIIIAKDKTDDTICGLVVGFPNEDLFFGAYLLVAEKYQGGGLGTVIASALGAKAGDKNVILSTSERALSYQKRGLKIQATQTVWTGTFCKEKCTLINAQDTEAIPKITKVKDTDITSVVDYDKSLHPYKRDWFIERCVFGISNRLAYVARENTVVVGYGYINFSPISTSSCSIILFANSENTAIQLLSNLLNELVDGVEITLTVPSVEQNSSSRYLAEKIGLKERSTVALLYSKYPVELQWQRTFFSEKGCVTLT